MGYPQPGQQGSPYAKAELVQMPPGQKAKVRNRASFRLARSPPSIGNDDNDEAVFKSTSSWHPRLSVATLLNEAVDFVFAL